MASSCCKSIHILKKDILFNLISFRIQNVFEDFIVNEKCDPFMHKLFKWIFSIRRALLLFRWRRRIESIDWFVIWMKCSEHAYNAKLHSANFGTVESSKWFEHIWHLIRVPSAECRGYDPMCIYRPLNTMSWQHTRLNEYIPNSKHTFPIPHRRTFQNMFKKLKSSKRAGDKNSPNTCYLHFSSVCPLSLWYFALIYID